MARQTRRVLLVDDDKLVGSALQQMIDPGPEMQFLYCSNPLSAIEAAESFKPTVILLDMMMPEIDGITVLRYLRVNEATRNIPVVVLSASDDSDRKAVVFKEGGNDYLIKLPEKTELLARIRYHSEAYIHLLERDAAFQSLRESQDALTESNKKLEQLAASDGLTGLANRRKFDETLEVEWRRAARSKGWLSLILFDIDFFKKCNDIYGHQTGDEVLKKVAGAIGGSLHRATDLAARYGGEEFVVVLPDADPEGGMRVGEKIRKNIEALGIENKGSSVSTVSKIVTVSGGLASTTPDLKLSPASFIAAADQALYKAKEAGRNRVFKSCTGMKVKKE